MEIMDPARVLTEFDLFDGLDQQTQQQMAGHMHMHTYPSGQVIVLAGDTQHGSLFGG